MLGSSLRLFMIHANIERLSRLRTQCIRKIVKSQFQRWWLLQKMLTEGEETFYVTVRLYFSVVCDLKDYETLKERYTDEINAEEEEYMLIFCLM